MAGGATLIAGGGAVLGAAGGSGISATVSMALATNGSYVLDECAKLATFCEVILIGRYGDLASVVKIHAVLSRRIVELEARIEASKRGVSDGGAPGGDGGDADEKDEVDPKKGSRF